MWQHDIIDMLRTAKTPDAAGAKILAELVGLLRGTTCFYFGTSENIFKGIPRKNIGDTITDFKIPFESCLFEYKANMSHVASDHVSSSRRANLALDCAKYADTEIVRGVLDMQDVRRRLEEKGTGIGDYLLFVPFYFLDEMQSWVPSSVVSLLCKKDVKSLTVVSPFLPKIAWEEAYSRFEDHMADIQEELNAVGTLLMFLHCRNIYTENVVPAEKMNKSRTKKGKEPMHQYKILKVQTGAVRTKYTDVSHNWGERTDCLTAEHLCRGHYKEYTEDAPLFGKYVGRFWWGPQVRGKKENGTIRKEYNIV